MAEQVTLVTQGVSKRRDYQRAEAELLRAVRHLIHDGGFNELCMARIAEVTGYTRKTVYNHFANIEDAVVAVCLQSVARRADLVSRAALFRGSSRERMSGIGSVAREVLPHHQRHEVLLSAINMDQVPEDRRRRLRAQEDRLIAIITGVIRDAVAAGDLELPSQLTPEQLALTLAQMEVGPTVLALRGWGLGGYSSEDSLEVFAYTVTLLLDVLGWRPLSNEFDYGASIRRMWREIFPGLLEKFDSPLLKTNR
jgi:AcrR family transcriptional regulator